MKTMIVLSALALMTTGALAAGTMAPTTNGMAPAGNAMMGPPPSGGMMGAPHHKPKPKKPVKPTHAMHPANSMAPPAGGMMAPVTNTGGSH